MDGPRRGEEKLGVVHWSDDGFTPSRLFVLLYLRLFDHVFWVWRAPDTSG